MTIGRLIQVILRCGLLIFLVLTTVDCEPRQPFYMATAEPVTLKLAYRRQTVNIQPLLDAFQAKYPNIKVETIDIQRFGNQAASILKTTKFDILRENREALAYAQDGMLRALDDLMLDEWASLRSDYFKGSWEGLATQGQQWGIPAGLDMYVVYLNVDQLKALNLPVPGADWTLSNSLELAMKANYPGGLPHNPSGKLFGFCTNPENVFDPVAFIYLHGGRIVDNIETPTQATLNEPRTIEAVQWYADLFTRHNVTPLPDVVRSSFPRGNIYEAAVRGSCTIWLGQYSGRGGQEGAYKWSINWKMLPLPKDRVDFNAGDVDGYYISKDCTHPREAMKLLKFLAERWESSGQKLPPRRSLINDPTYTKAVGEGVATVAKTFSDKVLILPVRVGPGLEKVAMALVQGILRSINEGQPAATTMADAQKECQGVFAK